MLFETGFVFFLGRWYAVGEQNLSWLQGWWLAWPQSSWAENPRRENAEGNRGLFKHFPINLYVVWECKEANEQWNALRFSGVLWRQHRLSAGPHGYLLSAGALYTAGNRVDPSVSHVRWARAPECGGSSAFWAGVVLPPKKIRVSPTCGFDLWRRVIKLRERISIWIHWPARAARLCGMPRNMISKIRLKSWSWGCLMRRQRFGLRKYRRFRAVKMCGLAFLARMEAPSGILLRKRLTA